tara:strand:+ start:9333 stop:11666 length:2334 start_codon:yes stop_codon:yes gene_type:complete
MKKIIIKYKTKAETLKNLTGKLKYADVLPMYLFTTKDWKKNQNKCTKELKKKNWFKWPLIVRSSHNSEDSHNSSLAGHFDSILNVNSDLELIEAVDKVIESYKTNSKINQIFIQPMLANVKMSGVVLSHDINTSSPYFSINYNDTSTDTTSITGGSKNNKILFYHHSNNGIVPKKLEKIISLAKELFEHSDRIPVDIEFATDKNDKCYLLQIRKLILKNFSKISTENHNKTLKEIGNKLDKSLKPHPYLFGKKTIFGVMPDWNPAEMIGIRPRPLALSLYQNLITDSTWAYQRDNYGYRKLRGFPLMQSFGGVPFIDLRVSFNSFIPKSLDTKIAEKLVNFYLDVLTQKPHLHDKIEFDIAYTCYTFDLPDRIRKLEKNGFSANEINKIKKSLRDLTNRIINYNTGIWRTDLQKIKELLPRRQIIEKSKLKKEDKIFFLLEDCRRYGTLPFAGLARVGFIAVEFLNSLVKQKIISLEDKQKLLLSLETITTSLSKDIRKLSRKKFLQNYGHLRPGTYDIRSKRYDENYDTYFSYHSKSIENPIKRSFSLSSKQRILIDKLLKKHGIDYNADFFIKFIKKGIEAREYAKFEFTKNVSLILKLLSELGKKYGITRDDCSFIDIRIIYELMNSSKDLEFVLKRSIEYGKEEFFKTEKLNLPSLIYKTKDIWCFSQLPSEPNFITQKKIIGQIQIASEDKVDLDKKIVFIKSADPGYDWIFTKKIAGLVTKYGGANSHMAIRANELGIPSVIGAGDQFYDFWIKYNFLSIDCSKKKVEVLS